MGAAGVPEIVVMSAALVLWAIPMAAAVWALFTLSRIRSEQQGVRTKLEAIERLLQRS